jgi:hypothetical protein
MKKLIYSLNIVLLASCSFDGLIKENEKVHYKFNNSDYEMIPTKYNDLSSSTIYKNVKEESIEIKNSRYNIHENVYSNSQTAIDYYHDNLYISLDCPSKNGNIIFEFDINKFENELSYKITFWFSNFGQQFSIKSPSEDNVLIEKTINNITYKKVRIFKLSDNLFLETTNGLKINKFYFDLKSGIIGLENTLNNDQFWIVN